LVAAWVLVITKPRLTRIPIPAVPFFI
jgi:hypothetical protein